MANEELTVKNLTSMTDDLSKKYEELKGVPAEINSAVDEFKWTPFYLMISDIRDDVQALLKKVITEIAKVVEGLLAPILFVDYADKWQKLGQLVNGANQTQAGPEINLEGYWDGGAYRAYKQSAAYQAGAMTSITSMCNTVKDQLLNLAEEGRTLYKTIIDKMASILASAALAIAEIAGTAGIGAIAVMSTLNDAIVGAVELVVQTITSFAEIQVQSWSSQNTFQNLILNPTGFFPGGDGSYKWPSTETAGYDHKDDGWKADGA